jgi:hypothetical protein
VNVLEKIVVQRKKYVRAMKTTARGKKTFILQKLIRL